MFIYNATRGSSRVSQQVRRIGRSVRGQVGDDRQVAESDNDDGAFVSFYSSFTYTYGMAQVAELQQWWHHYFSLVVRRDVKQCFKVVEQVCFVCVMP